MTFIPRQQEKHCFVACSEDKVNAGLCDCINRIRNEALHQPLVIGSVCDKEKCKHWNSLFDRCKFVNKDCCKQTDL